MFRKIVPLYLIIVFTLLLTACGNQQIAAEPTVSEPSMADPTVAIAPTDTSTPTETPAASPTPEPPPVPELPPLTDKEFEKLEKDATNLMIRARPKCRTCHRLGDEGNAVGPDLTNIGAVAAGRIPGMSARDYIEQAILEPDAFIAPDCPGGPCGTTSMPSYNGQFNEEKLDTLLTYLTYLIGDAPTAAAGTGSLPLANFATDHFAGSGNCATCHTDLTDSAGNDVSIDSHWRSTMMANAAKDPLWQAKVSSEVARTPALQEVIEGKCVTCHMPMANIEATTAGDPALMLDDGFSHPDHPQHAAAMDGVSCTVCHQIQDEALGEPESFSGHFAFDADTAKPDRAIFGPFANPEQKQMRNETGFTPVQSAHVEDSGLCATCHTLYTPYVDAAGNIAGEFPEQTPYLEWEHSDFADTQSCQQCHMPQADGEVVVATRPGYLAARAPFVQHHFVGGNSFMLNIFKNNSATLQLTAPVDALETTYNRIINQLQTTTAELSIISLEQQGNTLTAQVQVDHKTGHKFPTGFPSRRAWLHVTVVDTAGKTVFESGQPQADGSIIGSDSDENVGGYEPHYDLITRPDQVQIYEALMENTDGDLTYTLLRGAGYLKDNRLLPAGFDKETAPADIAVYGQATADDNFTGAVDQITYQVDTAGFSGPFTISVEMLYQTAAYPFMQDLRQDTTDNVIRFNQLYDTTDKTPVLIATVTQEN